MKRILAVLLAVMMLVAIVPATSLAESVSNGTNSVYHVATQSDPLRLRSGPGTSYRIIARLARGQAVIKIGSSGNWYKVKTPSGLTGYASKNYLKPHAHAAVETRESGLRVRNKPNGSKVYYSIPHGARGVTVYRVNGNWAEVTYNGQRKGWASLSYLRYTPW